MTSELAECKFLEDGWHISYMVNYATGEGVRVCIAVAGSQECAEKILKSKIEEDFYRAIESSPITTNCNDEVARMLLWIPDAVKMTLGKIPLGAGEYYADLYYNLS